MQAVRYIPRPPKVVEIQRAHDIIQRQVPTYRPYGFLNRLFQQDPYVQRPLYQEAGDMYQQPMYQEPYVNQPYAMPYVGAVPAVEQIAE